MIFNFKIRHSLAWSAFSLVLLGASVAEANDAFEIQVYQAEVNAPFQPGLELHANYTIQGRKEPEYDGEVAPDRALRLTLEPALGITEFLEIGAYLQGMATMSGDSRFAGAKLRAKFVVPERLELPLFLGLNIELGRVPRAVEEDGWANELRPIIGWTNGYFLFDVNPIIGYALSGPEKLRLHFEPAFKASYNTQVGFALGLEYYAGLGLIDKGFSRVGEQEHLAFLAFDLAKPAGSTEEGFELNAALGRGLTDGTSQKWIFKMIVGRAF